jgi:hypothetical protein
MKHLNPQRKASAQKNTWTPFESRDLFVPKTENYYSTLGGNRAKLDYETRDSNNLTRSEREKTEGKTLKDIIKYNKVNRGLYGNYTSILSVDNKTKSREQDHHDPLMDAMAKRYKDAEDEDEDAKDKRDKERLRYENIVGLDETKTATENLRDSFMFKKFQEAEAEAEALMLKRHQEAEAEAEEKYKSVNIKSVTENMVNIDEYPTKKQTRGNYSSLSNVY